VAITKAATLPAAVFTAAALLVPVAPLILAISLMVIKLLFLLSRLVRTPLNAIVLSEISFCFSRTTQICWEKLSQWQRVIDSTIYLSMRNSCIMGEWRET